MLKAQLPPENEMKERLTQSGLLGVSEHTDAFYNSLVSGLCGRTKASAGIVMSWQLAEFDTLKGLPAEVIALIDNDFEDFVTAISPTEEFAAEVIAGMKEARSRIGGA